jgi:leukotriene-A4 hydrolase
MENACLTFATPTVIAHDRSSVDLAAHEIAHVREFQRFKVPD